MSVFRALNRLFDAQDRTAQRARSAALRRGRHFWAGKPRWLQLLSAALFLALCSGLLAWEFLSALSGGAVAVGTFIALALGAIGMEQRTRPKP